MNVVVLTLTFSFLKIVSSINADLSDHLENKYVSYSIKNKVLRKIIPVRGRQIGRRW